MHLFKIPILIFCIDKTMTKLCRTRNTCFFISFGLIFLIFGILCFRPWCWSLAMICTFGITQSSCLLILSKSFRRWQLTHVRKFKQNICELVFFSVCMLIFMINKSCKTINFLKVVCLSYITYIRNIELANIYVHNCLDKFLSCPLIGPL